MTTVVAKLGAIDAFVADVAALKAQNMLNKHGKSQVLLEEGEVDRTWIKKLIDVRTQRWNFLKYEGGDL